MRTDNGGTMFVEHQSSLRNRRNLVTLFKQSESPSLFSISNNSDVGSEYESSNSIRNSNASLGSPRYSNSTTTSGEGEGSPFVMSPWNQASPYNKSPWISPRSLQTDFGQNGLIGSIVREEGHIYSLAASGDLLYTGSDSKNIHVWKNLKQFSGFKAKSGLVKAIVILGDRIFTGHQDGKIRVWKVSSSDPRIHKRFGSLPSFKDLIKRSVKPKNYVEVRNKRSVLRIKHYDAVSCLSLNEEAGLLYSGSWDKTVKVWRIANSKCLESIDAHDDAINSVVAGFDSLVFTGSADGTVKVWKRELQGKATKHFPIQILLKQEIAVTSLAVNRESVVLYCGSSDGLVNFWENEGKYQLSHGGVLRGHKMAVLCLSTGGNLVFSGSADKSICVWRREEGGVHTCLSVLTGHKGPIKCLAVEEDHQTSTKSDRKWIVYSGSLDKSVKVWRVSERSPDFKEIKQGLLNSYGGGANDDTVLGNNISR